MPTELTTIVTYGTFLLLCIVYLIYVTIGLTTFNRLLDRRCMSINVADVGIVLPMHSGTVHSMSYLISNPLQLADGRRLQRLGVFDQIVFGVRHFHVELYAKNTEIDGRPVADIDGRVRTLSHDRDAGHPPIVIYLLVNGTMTEYNVLDLIDQLHEYGKCFVSSSRRPAAIHLWIGGIRLMGNLEANENDSDHVRRTISDRLFDRLNDYVTRMKFRREYLELERASDETWFERSIGDGGIARGTKWENKVTWYEHIEDKINLVGTNRPLDGVRRPVGL